MIDTYGMDDINTQAIRELTTEVDMLKSAIKKINNAIATIPKISYELISYSLGSATLSAGEVKIYVLTPSLSGKKLIGFLFSGVVYNNQTVETVIMQRASIIEDQTRISITLQNLSEDSVNMSTLKLGVILSE